MKRVFMRALWGIYDNSNRILRRRGQTDAWIDKILKNKYNTPFITYVFGEDNYKYLVKKGVNDCILINKDPLPYDALKAQYLHKLEAMKYAMEVDGYDEMVHMDWDVIPLKPLPSDFWEVLNKKEKFQACLQIYHRRRAMWRKRDLRKIPNGGFVYIRDKNIPSEIIKIWETMKGPSVEPPMAKYVDNLTDGWKGSEYYWDHFEIDFCNLHKMSAHPIEKIKRKNICFIHYQGR